MTAAGIVLCGGKSTRMGVPKATLPFGNETMLQRVVRILHTVASPIVVVAAREQSLPELPADIIVTRDEREAQGPLEGLRAGLSTLPASIDVAYATSCDVPLLEPAFVTRMVELLGDHDIAVAAIGAVMLAGTELDNFVLTPVSVPEGSTLAGGALAMAAVAMTNRRRGQARR